MATEQVLDGFAAGNERVVGVCVRIGDAQAAVGGAVGGVSEDDVVFASESGGVSDWTGKDVAEAFGEGGDGNGFRDHAGAAGLHGGHHGAGFREAGEAGKP